MLQQVLGCRTETTDTSVHSSVALGLVEHHTGSVVSLQ